MTRALIHPATIIGLVILLVSTWAALIVASVGQEVATPILGTLMLCTSATVGWALPDRPAATSPGAGRHTPAARHRRVAAARGRRRPASGDGPVGATRSPAAGPTCAAGRGRRPLPQGACPVRPGAREVSFAPGRASVAAGRGPADTLIILEGR